MEVHDLVSQIEDLGLSNKEAKVYLACLGLGASSVQSIADRAGIKRVTTYVILESLAGLGLVTRSVKAKKTYFIAENPAHLESLLKKRADDLAEQVIGLKQILPQLSALRAVPKELPEVKIYDGVDAVSQLCSDFFTTEKDKRSEILQLSNIEELSLILPGRALARVNSEQARVQRRSRLLYTSEKGAIYQGEDRNKARESRFLPPDKYPISGEVAILGQSVLIISLVQSRPVGVVIRNTEMTATLKVVFEMAWELSALFNEN
jgi:sugar-specific transcriptional regulator TrmB